jgi:hypothetical protein
MDHCGEVLDYRVLPCRLAVERARDMIISRSNDNDNDKQLIGVKGERNTVVAPSPMSFLHTGLYLLVVFIERTLVLSLKVCSWFCSGCVVWHGSNKVAMNSSGHMVGVCAKC